MVPDYVSMYPGRVVLSPSCREPMVTQRTAVVTDTAETPTGAPLTLTHAGTLQVHARSAPPELERDPTGDRAARSRRTLLANPKSLLILLDGVTIAIAMAVAFAVRSWVGVGDVDGARTAHLLLGAGALPVWLGLFARRRLYNARFLGRRVDELRRIASASAVATMLMTVAAYALQLPASRLWLTITWCLAVVGMIAEREVIRRAFARARARGRMLRSVVIVGSNQEALEVASMLDDDPTLGYQVVGFVDDHEQAGGRVLGPVAETLKVVRRTGASSVIVAASATSVDTSNRLVRELLREGVHVELSSTLRDIAAHRLTVRPLGRFPVVYLEPCESAGWRAAAKRSFDIAVAGAALIAIAPVAALVALAVRLDSRGPVIFRQKRVGKDGEVFEFLKFRSMVDGAHSMWIDLRHQANDATGPIFKLRDDPRVTSVGRWLRKTSLDELPQLWNILRGQMSLVGPRPALPEEMELWDDQLHDRLRVRPGLTGMWQVSGRHEGALDDYTRLDLYYVDNWSLLTDVVVVLKTIPVVLFGRGSY